MAPPSRQKPRYLALLFGLLLNALLHHEPGLRLLGAINVRLRLIGCVFLVYPPKRPLLAQRRGFRALVERFRWRPVMAGLFRQGSVWGITFGVSASEPELIDVRNAEQLRALVKHMEHIRTVLRADRCALAGLLPSILDGRGVERTSGGEAEVAAHCVLLAIEEVRRVESLSGCPVLVLGSRGFVGSRVLSLLGDGVYAVDREQGSGPVLPESLRGQRALVVNITWANVLDTYADQMWPGLVVLNEVYPPPSVPVVRALGQKGVSVWHLAGVEGAAFPPFPDAYSGGIPCCAAQRASDMRVRLVRLARTGA